VPDALVVPLERADDPLSTVDAVLSRIPGEGLSTSLPEALWEAYDGAAVLLVLEDVDRVQGLADVIDELTTGYPAASVLCTALRPTHVPGERVVRLLPLPLPADDAPADQPALLLFAARAADRGVPVDLADADTRTQVARVCRHAGGLPGTIELAAAHVDAVPPAVMARTMGAARGVDAALEWSIDLLSKAARTTFVQLSVFAGPFLLDAAAAVVDLGSTSGDPAEVLLELVDAHLLELDPGSSGEPRFVVPELVRGFARRRLDADGLAAEVKDRHATYFLNRARAGGEVVRRAWPDIAAALDHELDHGRFDDALASAVSLAPELQETPGAAASLQERIAELLERGEEVPDRLRAQALMWSTSTWSDGESADMQRFGLWTAQRLAEATTLARESGDGPALLALLETTIRSLRITLDLASAVSAAHEGLDLAGRLDDQRALSRFECYVGMAARSTGDVERAVRLATSAIERGRAYDDPVAVTSAAQLLLALPPELQPNLDPPLPTLEELLEQCERTQQPFVGMTVLASLAQEGLARGDTQAAAGWLWRLLMIGANRQRTEPMATLAGIALLLSVAVAQGQPDDAARLRESTRPLELFLPLCIAPEALPVYQRDVALLDGSVPEERRLQLAADAAASGLAGTNRWAQGLARRLAGHRSPDPRASSPEAPRRADLTPREREVLENNDSATALGEVLAAHTIAELIFLLGWGDMIGRGAWSGRE
jgi:predicted ATPase